MTKLVPAAVVCVAAQLALIASPLPAQAQEVAAQAAATVTEQAQAVNASRSDMLYDSQGRRVNSVYRVMNDGSVRLLMNGKSIIIPVGTLSRVDGKLTTTYTRREIRKMR